jgi:hypothetical protein
MNDPHSIEGKKTVRIDSNTLICVCVSIPDEVARQKYLEKRASLSMQTESPRWKQKYKKANENTKIDDFPEDIPESDLQSIEAEVEKVLSSENSVDDTD